MTSNTYVTDLLTTVQTSLNGAIGDALPLAGGIMAAVAGIFLGVKLFKRITGAKS
jgi:hypothetical protein